MSQKQAKLARQQIRKTATSPLANFPIYLTAQEIEYVEQFSQAVGEPTYKIARTYLLQGIEAEIRKAVQMREKLDAAKAAGGHTDVGVSEHNTPAGNP